MGEQRSLSSDIVLESERDWLSEMSSTSSAVSASTERSRSSNTCNRVEGVERLKG